MTKLSAINGTERVASSFDSGYGNGNNKISFAKIKRALINADGTIPTDFVPPRNTGSIYNYGFVAGSSRKTASTNI